MRDDAPTFGSLFAGAGGFDYGLERAGLRCAWIGRRLMVAIRSAAEAVAP